MEPPIIVTGSARLDTIKKTGDSLAGRYFHFWLQILENLYIVFPVRLYHKNIGRAILKEPKYYFFDTGLIENSNGAQIENIAACAFIKELHFIEDVYGVKTSINFIKNKQGKEIDFFILLQY